MHLPDPLWTTEVGRSVKGHPNGRARRIEQQPNANGMEGPCNYPITFEIHAEISPGHEASESFRVTLLRLV